MEIIFLAGGQKHSRWVAQGVDLYCQRLRHFVKFRYQEITPDKRTLRRGSMVLAESQAILQRLDPGDYLVLLDEKGRQYSSRDFAGYLQKRMNAAPRRLVFVSGGAYGFHSSLLERANGLISLSSMTFPHHLVRVVFLEQLYRAFSILKNTPYHND